MIVRLKKRGDWPHPMHPLLDIFRGCCLEVEPAEAYHDETCSGVDTTGYRLNMGCSSGKVFVITDGRYLAMRPHTPPSTEYPNGKKRCICEHCLVEDLNTFDSDFCDEDAKEGDLVFVQTPLRDAQVATRGER